ncbi:MAG: M20/M25/M40 family metallo-hydrolase [Chloroflexaceae bacterium]|jgi:succinyl-diaminopimelate desuccinylase|nr:M20/M25/M40 family metallo-hydrolase [Chloroflexaceae bacterium]
MGTLLHDELAALTADMVRFESTADRPDQLVAAMDYVAAYLATIPGIFVSRVEHNGKPSVVATLRETRTPSLMLNGHLDVVAARPAQFRPEVRDGRLYGRGSQDMKGSVAVMLRLLKDLAAQNERPDVGFQFVSDEEIGGFDGTGWLLDQGWRCDLLVALEPTDMQICYAMKGPMWLELRIPGAPAHGSRPWDGRNPLLELSAGLERLVQRFPTPEVEMWRTTVTPTVVQTSGSRNQVPQDVTLTLDVRYTEEDTPDTVRAAVQSCFPTATIVIDRAGSPMFTSAETPSLQRLARATESLRGQPTSFYREHFASDARFYSGAGIPAICFGPVGKGLHSDEEWVDLASLAELHHVLMTFIKG